jgi:ABC-type sugar transport system ATPase subunit
MSERANGRSEVDAQPEQPLLAVRHLSKHFGHIRAVQDVNLDFYSKEVVGLIGDNGAGKSTFLSLLTGFYRSDSGEFIYEGRRVNQLTPKISRRVLKIEMIYQNLRLAPDLTVWENLFLGEEARWARIFADRRLMRSKARDVLKQLNTNIDADELVRNLSGGEQQAVAIGRAILFDRRIILMDEPTAAISVAKVNELLELIKGLRKLGRTVVIVSHRLEDILEVADRVVVFRQGQVAQVVRNVGLSIDDLVRMMFGGRKSVVSPQTTGEAVGAPPALDPIGGDQ